MRGFFRMDYAREGGGGGTILFTDQSVSGWDTGGAFFRGTYRDVAMGIEGELSMNFPNGGLCVTGLPMAKGGAPLIVPFHISNAAAPTEMVLDTVGGFVGVKLTRVSSL